MKYSFETEPDVTVKYTLSNKEIEYFLKIYNTNPNISDYCSFGDLYDFVDKRDDKESDYGADEVMIIEQLSDIGLIDILWDIRTIASTQQGIDLYKSLQ
jgi:hypothetical protein